MVMNVTSMLSNGYLRPVIRTGVLQDVARQEPLQDQALARQEQQVLAEEQGLRLDAGPLAEVSTVYHYTLGPDGRRYITGASVVVKGGQEEWGGTSSLKTAGSRTAADEGAERKDGASKVSGDGGPGGALEDKGAPEKDAVVRELRNTEREVIAHEAAHQAAAGRFGGPVSYTRTTGPDGKSYITGGEVPIHFVAGSTPEETLRNLEQVQKAALAPGDPSAQDIRVAAQAAARAAQARHDIAQSREKDGAGRVAAVPGRKGEDPSKTGVSSVLAALRFSRLQDSPA
nr:putative metalloprotease CJM1_0395 family protein [uncultured Fretibacterium sp.]